MQVEPFIRILAGTFVIADVALAHVMNSWWLLLPAMVSVDGQCESTS